MYRLFFLGGKIMSYELKARVDDFYYYELKGGQSVVIVL